MENAPFDLLNLIADVGLEEIDRQIEFHSQQVDCLRLLRQIVEIRQEQGPPAAQELKASETINQAAAPPISEPVKPRRSTITENHVSRNGRMPKGHPRQWSAPVPGTYAHQIVELLKNSAEIELATAEIAKRLGVPYHAITPTLRTWTKNGVLEKVRWGVWKLADRNEPSTQIDSPAEPPPSSIVDLPAIQDDPPSPSAALERNRQMVANYLEFNQPAKPTTIAIDTGLDVVDVLAALECDQFERADRGWIRARQPAAIT